MDRQAELPGLPALRWCSCYHLHPCSSLLLGAAQGVTAASDSPEALPVVGPLALCSVGGLHWLKYNVPNTLQGFRGGGSAYT